VPAEQVVDLVVSRGNFSSVDAANDILKPEISSEGVSERSTRMRLSL
jgi:hypothetical protein